MTMPKATLTRFNTLNNQTCGVLVAEDGLGNKMEFKTIELAWKGNQRNISCIPVGKYMVKRIYWLRKTKYVYEVQQVPNRSGIFIHAANYASELRGCIALGNQFMDINRDGALDLLNSRKSIAVFEAFMSKKSFILEIKNDERMIA